MEEEKEEKKEEREETQPAPQPQSQRPARHYNNNRPGGGKKGPGGVSRGRKPGGRPQRKNLPPQLNR